MKVWYLAPVIFIGITLYSYSRPEPLVDEAKHYGVSNFDARRIGLDASENAIPEGKDVKASDLPLLIGRSNIPNKQTAEALCRKFALVLTTVRVDKATDHITVSIRQSGGRMTKFVLQPQEAGY